MRIERIEVCGFGPFRDPQVIDVARYTDDGIFLITGRTGAGKSSILDAICFALYGSAPRYDDGEKRLRSDYASQGEPTEVALEFTVGTDRWRIERSPQYERPKKRGEGTTIEPSSVTLFRGEGDGWIGVASKEREVGGRVIGIVGMNGEQFQQVILLAQGRFARFLLAKNDERQALLRSLFGTRRFEDYQSELDERRKAAESAVLQQVGDLRAILDQIDGVIARADESAQGGEAGALVDADGTGAHTPPAADDWDARIRALDTAAARADARAAAAGDRVTAAAAARDAAESAHDERRRTAERQERRDGARDRIANLDAERESIDTARSELDAARRANTVTTAIDAVTRADAESERAAGASVTARDKWTAAHEDTLAAASSDSAPPTVDADPPELDAFADELGRRIGAWEPLREVEARLDADAQAISDDRTQLSEHIAEIARLDDRSRDLPTRIAHERKARDAAMQRAARADAVAAEIRDLEGRVAAAHDVEKLTAAYADAEEQARNAAATRTTADDALSDLHRRRLAGYSGELAEALAPGEPCAVCGSRTHPAPAEGGPDHVTDAAIDRATDARTAAASAHDAAVQARQSAHAELRSAQERAGGRTAEEIDGDLTAARQRRDDAEHATREVQRHDQAIANLETELASLEKERAQATEERVKREGAIVAAEKSLADARATVEAARGDFGSVADRIAATQRLAATARACADTARDADRAARAADDDRRALDEALATAQFVSGDDARAAHRTAEQIARLDERISAADTDRRASAATLTELAAFDLPDERVDLESAAATLADARAAHDRDTRHAQEARHLGATLDEAAGRARDAYERVRADAERAAVVSRLANTVAGRAPNDRRMNLETFVLAAELEQIVQAANQRLAEMSDNRYELRHTDARAHRNAASGLGIEVLDAFTGRARPPHTLSGGETFLASLALALGLAEVVTNRSGGVRLDTLFIDEGFGSLDSETLEIAMRTLDDLRQGGRTVGLISHVAAMKEQILAQIRVRQTHGGWSVVEQ